jgi:hypothetical protein
VWRLAPDTGYGKYYQIDLTGYLWVDSVVVSYTIRAEEGGSAYTRGDFNGYWWVHPEPDNPNGWVTWELHSDGSGLRQNSADNYVLIGNAASSTCNLDLIGIGCRVYGALTSQPAVKSGISPLSSVPRPQAIPVWVSHR